VQLGDAGGVISFSALPLYWRVCLINALMFLVATVILVVSPATVSPRGTGSELVLLAVGLVVVVMVNSLLLRSSLAPLDRLIKVMEQVDPAPQPAPAPGRGWCGAAPGGQVSTRC
jgi:two-component system, NarL family, sensor histidine kinase UhpB